MRSACLRPLKFAATRRELAPAWALSQAQPPPQRRLHGGALDADLLVTAAAVTQPCHLHHLQIQVQCGTLDVKALRQACFAAAAAVCALPVVAEAAPAAQGGAEKGSDRAAAQTAQVQALASARDAASAAQVALLPAKTCCLILRHLLRILRHLLSYV